MAEKEFIERGAVISCILDVNNNLAGVVQHINEHVPAVDAVEVVRCKDCKHWGGVTFGYVCHRFSGSYIRNETRETDFCSYGERKEQK